MQLGLQSKRGGGVAFIRAQRVIGDLSFEDEDERIGAAVVSRALEEPLRQIAENAGNSGTLVVERVRRGEDPNFGFNAQTEEYEDLVAAGIIDPAKVIRTALENAASIAGLLLATEAVVSELQEGTRFQHQAARREILPSTSQPVRLGS